MSKSNNTTYLIIGVVVLAFFCCICSLCSSLLGGGTLFAAGTVQPLNLSGKWEPLRMKTGDQPWVLWEDWSKFQKANAGYYRIVVVEDEIQIKHIIETKPKPTIKCNKFNDDQKKCREHEKKPNCCVWKGKLGISVKSEEGNEEEGDNCVQELEDCKEEEIKRTALVFNVTDTSYSNIKGENKGLTFEYPYDGKDLIKIDINMEGSTPSTLILTRTETE